ncbi:hypothetical protein RUM43_000836 [Polyplax serrata]|uniref:C2H2-type domain-containing protein n=1 Tax=Polyplax serrata TaxID=468196 RepID=A0AAN8SEG2_POLSC
MTVILCPLCSLPCFKNLDSLRFSLIKAATQNISCPLCNEILVGLDKLTIHLFGHTLNQNCNELIELNASQSNFPWLKEPNSIPNDELEVEIGYRETKSSLDEHMKGEANVANVANVKNDDQCTINMEDLGFLTSLENCLKSVELEDRSKPKTLDHTMMVQNVEDPVENIKEDNIHLSEYMSNLLTKKLPIFNFTFSGNYLETEKSTCNTDGKQFMCPDCNSRFDTSNELFSHVQLVHSNLNHCRVKGGTKFENENSTKTDNSPRSSVAVEELSIKDLVLPRYDCHLCQKSFKMKGSLLVHYRVTHLGLNNPASLPTAGLQDGAEEKNFKCSICNKSFKREQHLTQHIKTHEGKQWQCTTCNKYFTTKYFLKKHHRLHTGEMPYSCQTCNKTFTFQQSYHKHLLYHSDDKPHQCMQCGRSFKELSTLHNHQRIHSGEKPFACETCGKCFRQRVSYIVHQRIHTGVLPYHCMTCKRRFRYKVIYPIKNDFLCEPKKSQVSGSWYGRAASRANLTNPHNNK